LDRALTGIQGGADTISALVAERSRTNADLAARLSRMQDLALPLHRLEEGLNAKREACHRSALELERALGELREHVREVEHTVRTGEGGARTSAPAGDSSAREPLVGSGAGRGD
jgi:hypothetical protein